MFKEEERKLEIWRERIEKIEVPENRIEQAIIIGFERGKNTRSNKKTIYYKRGIWSVVVAALLLVTLVTSIRVSPIFANAFASIPGMEKFVEMIRINKGYLAAIENDYYQPLGISSEQGGVTLLIEGVIADEQEMVLFHTIEGADKNKDERFWLHIQELVDSQGRNVAGINSGVSGSEFDLEGDKRGQSARTNIQFKEEVIGNEFILKATVQSDTRSFNFEIPFLLSKEKMPTTRYLINETVTIEGQKITVKQIEISPIKVGIYIEMDPQNTKRIFNFEDLRLVDEKGEIWSSITSGIGSVGDEYEKIIYLQSNYFEEPKKLNLMFNKLQALDKEETHLLIDTDSGIIVKQPSDQKFSAVEIRHGYIELLLNGEKEFISFPFNTIIDAKGNEHFFSDSGYLISENRPNEIRLNFSKEPLANPIKLPLSGYPQWIEGNVKIKVK